MSALLLFGLLHVFGAVASVVVPRLIDLLDKSPRSAMFGFLALIVSPGVFVAAVHRVTSGAIDRRTDAASSTATSSWAGALAWLVLFGTNLLSTFVMLVIHPPPPEQGLAGTFAAFTNTVFARNESASLAGAVWVAIAACLFALERSSRRSERDAQ